MSNFLIPPQKNFKFSYCQCVNKYSKAINNLSSNTYKAVLAFSLLIVHDQGKEERDPFGDHINNLIYYEQY